LEIDLAEVGPTLKGMNPATELHAVKSALGIVESPDPAEQREEAKRVARELEEASIGELPAKTDPETVVAVIDHSAELEEIKGQLAETRQQLEALRNPPKDAKTLREEANRAAREVEKQQIPPVPAASKRLASDVREQLDAAGGERFGRSDERWSYLDDYDPDGKWAVFHVSDNSQRRFVRVSYTLDADGAVVLGDTESEVVRTTSYRDVTAGKSFTTSELQEIKGQLAEARGEIDALKQKADEAGKEPVRVRPVDPLRKQADAVALEIASDGQSLRRPPKTAAPPAPPELVPLTELKRRMRDEMLGVLSGGMTE
jgi:DNA mismatch repair ATPase MutS